MAKRRPKWTQPKWMKPYVPLLVNTGGDWNTPEHAMNCDSKNCNLGVNGVRAILCAAVQSQVILLVNMHAKGMLADLLAPGTEGA